MELMVLLFVIFLILVWFSVKYEKNRARRFSKIYRDALALKQNASSTGCLFNSPYSSKKDFLNYMGHFFKHKKHEWIFIAFMKDDSVDKFWINKGFDKRNVVPFIDSADIAKFCKKKGYNRVLIGHNHPRGTLAPSKQDRISFEILMDYLAQKNISLEEFVFVAGRWRRYGLSLGQRIRRLFKGATQE